MSRLAVACVVMAGAFLVNGALSFDAARGAPAARGPSWQERRDLYEQRIRRDARLELHEASFWKPAGRATPVGER